MSGAARKEMNRKASNDAVEGRMSGIAFARVTRMVGENHIRVAIPCKTGYKEFLARIPNKFGKKGSTPLTSNSVVSIYVGEEFDADEKIPENTHFDVTSILDDKQTYQLVKDGSLPAWMMKSPDEISSGILKADATEGDGYEFDYLEGKKKEGEKDDEEENTVVHTKPNEDELDVDDI
jgi:hypothetical protein